MSRGVHNIKQSDLLKAIKAADKSGVKGWRVEVIGGKIVVFAADAAVAQGDTEHEPSEWD